MATVRTKQIKKEEQEKKEKVRYYSLNNILTKNAQYNMIIGERSNGKTYACLKYALERFIKTGEQVGLVRRWKEDLRGRRASVLFDSLVNDNVVSKLTNGEYTNIYYYAGKWFLAWKDVDTQKYVYDNQNPFAFAFAISDTEHDKSISYPRITTVIFDEFLSRQGYLTDEFVLFMNTLSTIIRQRNNVKIFMLGNTVNKYSPYFKEMGLTHVQNMKQGSIDVYKYGDSGLKLAIEYCASIGKAKGSALYFAFNNPRLQMINTGAWELDIYPHLPTEFKYRPMDICFTYFVEFEDTILQCEIIQKNNSIFTYIHRKTTPLKDTDNDMIFSLQNNPKPNYYVRLTKGVDNLSNRVITFFQKQKVFYQDNEVGEIIRNYVEASDNN